MSGGQVSKRLRLTREQDELRLRGLRILARMIVRRHLASLREADAGLNGSGSEDSLGCPGTPDGDLLSKEGGHVR